MRVGGRWWAMGVLVLAAGGCLEVKQTPQGSAELPASDTPETKEEGDAVGAGDTLTAPDVATETVEDVKTPDAVESCEPGEQRCGAAPRVIEMCDGGKWVAAAPCPDLWVCEAGTCRAETCGGILACLDLCEPGDPFCNLDTCKALATATARSDFDKLQTCVEDHQCSTDTDSMASWICLTQHCPVSGASCFYPSHGDDSCLDIIACSQDCKGDQECSYGCLLDGRHSAQMWATLLFICLEQSCKGKAGDQLVTCMQQSQLEGGPCASAAKGCYTDSAKP